MKALTLSREAERGILTKWADRPVGLHVPLKGKWHPEKLIQLYRENISDICSLVRRYLFLYLHPEHCHQISAEPKQPPWEERARWYVKRNRAKYGNHWHTDGGDLTPALCPRQQGNILPTGFADPTAVTKAIRRNLKSMQGIFRRGEVRELYHRMRANHLGSIETFLYSIARKKDEQTLRQLMRKVNVDLEAERKVYWHRWKPGDFLIWGNTMLHSAYESDSLQEGGGGTLWLFEEEGRHCDE